MAGQLPSTELTATQTRLFSRAALPAHEPGEAGNEGPARCVLRSEAMVRPLRRLWLGIGALLLTGCLSPTLPLPPPSNPVVTAPDAQGNIQLSGYLADPGAIAEAYDLRSNVLKGKESDNTGYYKFKMQAQSGDQIEFRYELGSDISPSVVVLVPK